MYADEDKLDITFRPAWGLDDPVIIRDAKELWLSLGALWPREVDQRASQLCAAAYVGNTLVGVSTAYLDDLAILKSRFAFFRCVVSPQHRRQWVSYRLAPYSRDVLEKWSLANPDEKVMGMVAVIQGENYKERQHEPVWPRSTLNVVGYTKLGDQIRVAWFKHASVP
jgi:hypothetical protein